MRWTQVRCFILGLAAYVHAVCVILSRTSAAGATTTAETTPSCGLREFEDVESRTVAASLVVDAVVVGFRRIGRTSSGFALYRARLTVTDVIKGRLPRSGDRPGSGQPTIVVGTFARASSRRRNSTTPAATAEDELCASFDLPARGSRHFVFLQQPTSSSSSSSSSSDVRASSSGRPVVVYSISSSPEPFSDSKLKIVRRYSRRRYGMWNDSLKCTVDQELKTRAANFYYFRNRFFHAKNSRL